MAIKSKRQQRIDVIEQLSEALTLALPHVPAGAVHPVRIHTEPLASCTIHKIAKAALAAAKKARP